MRFEISCLKDLKDILSIIDDDDRVSFRTKDGTTVIALRISSRGITIHELAVNDQIACIEPVYSDRVRVGRDTIEAVLEELRKKKQ